MWRPNWLLHKPSLPRCCLFKHQPSCVPALYVVNEGASSEAYTSNHCRLSSFYGRYQLARALAKSDTLKTKQKLIKDDRAESFSKEQ